MNNEFEEGSALPEIYAGNSSVTDSSDSFAPPDERVYESLALIELFENLVQDLGAFVGDIKRTSLDESKLDQDAVLALSVQGEVLYKRAQSLVTTLDTDTVALPIIKERSLTRQYKSKIERLGIGGVLIQQRQAGESIPALARHHTLGEDTIRRFFKTYDAAKPTEKARLRRNSMTDIVGRLEELGAMIYRQLARLEGNQDDIHVKYVTELRLTIELSSKLAQQMISYQRYEEFIRCVGEILKSELPDRKAEIIQKLNKLSSISNTRLLMNGNQ